MNKVVAGAAEAVRDVADGATVMMSGFGLCGIPEGLILALRDQGAKALTVISNNAGVTDFGISFLLQSGQVRKMVATYVGENKVFENMFLNGSLEVELVPQGTFAERIRAGGAGIPAFFTPAGYGTVVAEGKEVRWFSGKPYLMETALNGRLRSREGLEGRPGRQPRVPQDHAQLRTHDVRGGADHDRRGRVPGSRSGRSIPTRCTRPASSCTGSSRGSATRSGSRRRTLRAQGATETDPRRLRIVRRAALEMKDGDYVNLGIGMPTLAANHVPAGISIVLHSENGMLGVGPYPEPGEEDPDLINAGKETVSELPGSSLLLERRFVRHGARRTRRPDDPGGPAGRRRGQPRELDGSRPNGQGHGRSDGSGGRGAPRGGGDGAHGHATASPRFCRRCTLPLTGRRCVNLIVTELAVIEVVRDGLLLREIAPGTTLDQVTAATGAPLAVSPDLVTMAF